VFSADLFPLFGKKDTNKKIILDFLDILNFS